MKRFLSNWQGLLALVISIFCFWLSGDGLRLLDPTAGVFDLGYLQRPLVAIAWYALLEFGVWLFFQINMPTPDRWIDNGGFREFWEGLPPRYKWALIERHLALRLVALLLCLWLVPVG